MATKAGQWWQYQDIEPVYVLGMVKCTADQDVVYYDCATLDGRHITVKDGALSSRCSPEESAEYKSRANWMAHRRTDDSDTARLFEEIARLHLALSRQNDRVCQILGAALGYPRFCDDQENFPGATPENGVCVGEHTAETLAGEMADAYLRAVPKPGDLWRKFRDVGRNIYWQRVDKRATVRQIVRYNEIRWIVEDHFRGDYAIAEDAMLAADEALDDEVDDD